MPFVNKAEPKQWVAVVFKVEFKPGEWHSNHERWTSDRNGHQQIGDLWGCDTEDQLANPLPFWFEAIPIDGPPDYANGDTWDRAQRRFVKWHENKSLVADRIAHHEAELVKLKALL